MGNLHGFSVLFFSPFFWGPDAVGSRCPGTCASRARRLVFFFFFFFFNKAVRQRGAWACGTGWMAEWSKAGDSSSLLFGGVGSNPTPVKLEFFFFFPTRNKIKIKNRARQKAVPGCVAQR